MFYRNLIRLAEEPGGVIVPVDLAQPGGRRVYPDRGCIEIDHGNGTATVSVVSKGAPGSVGYNACRRPDKIRQARPGDVTGANSRARSCSMRNELEEKRAI